MGTTAQKLQAILDSKAAIKSTLSSMGYYVGDVLSQWADKLKNITISGDIQQYKYFMAFGAKGTIAAQTSNTSQFSTIESIYFDDSVRFQQYCFQYGCQYSNTLTSVRLPDKIRQYLVNTNGGTYALAYAFRNCTNISSAISIDFTEFFVDDPLPSKAQYMMNYAFDGCTSIPAITIKLPDVWNSSFGTLTSYMNYCFRNCTGMTSADIYGVKYQPSGTCFSGSTHFSGCTSLRNVTYHDVEAFGNKTIDLYRSPDGLGYLYNMPAVTTVNMPKLEKANIGGDAQGTITDGAFAQISSTVTDIYLPKCTYVAYCGLNPLTNATTVHFALENKSAIEACQNYDVKFAPNGNPNIVFDL